LLLKLYYICFSNKHPYRAFSGEAAMRPTVRQIAQQANVSASTVSRVLNHYPYVDEATRTAVLRAAESLGYAIKAAPRAAQATKSVLLLLRIDDTMRESEVLASHGIESSIHTGAQPILEKHGLTVRLQRTRMDPQEAQLYAAAPDVSGLIFVGGIVNRELVVSLQQAALPFVVAGSHINPLPVNCVMAAYLDGMAQVVEHLLATGHRRIALVNGPCTTTSSEEKQKGFLLALAQQGAIGEPLSISCGDFDAGSGYTMTQQLLAEAPDVDAIAYASDTMAIGGISALRESGRRVPDDVAVTGFYDYDIARFTDPPLTTARVDFQAMGAIAARRLLMLMNEPDVQAWTIVTPCPLVIRDSSCANGHRVNPNPKP
jgi:DNA-binding LacI/PurR family transcriptional regulator